VVLTVAALPTRIMWYLRVRTAGANATAICAQFPAYRTDYLTQTISRLLRLNLIEAIDGVYYLTPSGHAQAAAACPPRWSARRPTPPRTATISR
jgi:hypothetical protein